MSLHILYTLISHSIAAMLCWTEGSMGLTHPCQRMKVVGAWLMIINESQGELKEC